MKTRLIVLLSAIMLSVLVNSCKKNETDSSIPYYRFNEDDKNKLLLSYDVGEDLVYRIRIMRKSGLKPTYLQKKKPQPEAAHSGEATLKPSFIMTNKI